MPEKISYLAPIQISAALLKKASKGYGNDVLINGIVATFNKYAGYFGIDTKKEVAQFIAQSCHESDHFKTTKEYATGKDYEGRKDLGNVKAGDGVRMKGHGIFQTTGVTNHLRVGKRIAQLPFITDEEKKLFANDAIYKNPELLCLPVWATISAMIFWQDKQLDVYVSGIGEVDKMPYKRYRKDGSSYTDMLPPEECICRKINGGLNGFAERKSNYNSIIKLL